ncbi:glycoprotein-N-acetylgalactosamine 3-beta-galactosyltransferase 1-like isoform X2 [Gigantopelta aegis]|uniref:glycoprotein-N-acetylgalactosamine 3-beta-galactosyltransferase 1-like isoform X2 n=1 Tax=Gigantopelta aegis TaxID=1735272 RepID=UPI001B88B9BD|nr:glycoprotein-N-acetylgalactosamine 3-beta-galactosyltransferase 1-like isoform X2 [Gigantopelta aegis]
MTMLLCSKRLGWSWKWMLVIAFLSTVVAFSYLFLYIRAFEFVQAGWSSLMKHRDDQYNYAAISWRDNSFTNLLLKHTISDRLKRTPRILCFVMTTQQFEATKARAVNATWGRRCAKLLFITSYTSTLFPSHVVTGPEGRNHLTAKSMGALQHLYETYLDDYDYFLKADDDSYIVMENLQLMLSMLNPSEPSYLGFHFKYNVHQGYMSGGGTYVLSRMALRRVVKDGILRGGMCAADGNDEDIDVGACLEKVGVAPYATYDKFGRHAFHASNVKDFMIGPLSEYLRHYPSHDVKVGPNCCSQFSVSFHYMEPDMMYIMDFLLYRMSVFGLDTDYQSPHMTNLFPLQRVVVPHKDDKEILYA